jgi:transcriptional regulator with XRE-family HTH domain
MFYQKLTTLCAKKGLTVNGLTNELNFSNATATKWKRGSLPHYNTLMRIAKFFDVDVEYLVDTEYLDYDEWLQEVKGLTRAEVLRSDNWAKEKTESTNDLGLDEEFLAMAKQLTPGQLQRVKDFIRGMLS